MAPTQVARDDAAGAGEADHGCVCPSPGILEGQPRAQLRHTNRAALRSLWPPLSSGTRQGNGAIWVWWQGTPFSEACRSRGQRWASGEAARDGGWQRKDMSFQGNEAGWLVCGWGVGALGANIQWVTGESERAACEDDGFSLDGTGSQEMIQMWRVTVKFVSVLRGSICDNETSVAKRVPRTVAQTQ